MKIRYFAPWNKPIVLQLKDIVDITYERSYFSIFSEETRGGVYVFPRYCYDLLYILTKKEGLVEVNVNTIIFGFDKVIAALRKSVIVKYVGN